MTKRMTILIFFVFATVFSQTDIKNIIPLSPNLSSFTRYGEIPVSNFTGTANVSIPIYTIKTNNFNLPLALSYHTGGNKVEDVASWVGLGWSLGTIPIISRSVRGIPDESTPNGIGWFSKYLGYTAKELIEMDKENSIRQKYFQLLTENVVDSEPDVFYFNLLGKNGKFFFDQQQGKFVTLENSQIKISYNVNNGSFNVVTEEGFEYEFSERETTFNGSETTTTGWYVSKITSSNKSESISFEYDGETQTLTTLTPRTKLVFKEGIAGDVSQFTNQPLSSISTVSSQVLKKISFNGGIIEFIRDNIERLDLKGGYSLRNIKVKDIYGNEIVSYALDYKYIRGNSIETYTNKWMLLDKFKNTSLPTSTIDHTFFYNESAPPSRTSPAQDYWGYYNGATSNQDLVPKVFLPNTTILIPGADRLVNPAYSQFGILKKIIYPTGGYTEFDFENNDAYSTKLPSVYLDDSASIEGNVNDEPSSYYESYFTINNPPDKELNGNNPNGGSFANFAMGCGGCILNGLANANYYFLLMKEATPTSPVKFYPIASNYSAYLPNGNYKLTASINLTPSPDDNNAVKSDFFVLVTWKKMNPNKDPIYNPKYVGGLRVSEIRSNTGNVYDAPIVKRYIYKTDYNSNVSSGKVFNEPNFVFGDIIALGSDCVSGRCSGIYYRFKSYNNIQQTSFSGSPVGYETVIEESNDPTKTGVTIYKYTNLMDVVLNRFPFPPPTSFELHRGQPLETLYFKKDGKGTLTLLEKKEYKYNVQLSNGQLNSFKTLYGYKTGRWNYANGSASTDILPLTFDQSHVMEMYEIPIDLSLLASEKTTRYEVNGDIFSTKINKYESLNHLFLTSQTITSSNGIIQEAKYTYPQDLLSDPIMNQFVGANRINEPIIQENLANNVLISKSKTVYSKDVTTNNLLLPKEVYSAKFPNVLASIPNIGNLEKKLTYDKYDDNGNLLQYTPEAGAAVSIIWGYNKTLPVAKIENLAYSLIPSVLITAIENATLSTATEASLLTALTNLRNDHALSNAMVTTYTHIPLVGVSTITDPKGLKTTYMYDAFNRLELVKDHESHILQKYCYNYKGQQVNCRGVLYNNVAKSATFIKNCGAGFTASPVTYTVAAGTYTSTVSQEDADNKAQADVNAKGPNYANVNGVCQVVYKNVAKSGIFPRNNCGAGFTGGSVTYNVAAGTYSSKISQVDADNQAQNDVNTNGQNYANTKGTCTIIYYNVLKCGTFIKSDCSVAGEEVGYCVEPGVYSSTLSQADADYQAQSDVNANGQAYANANGGCVGH